MPTYHDDQDHKFQHSAFGVCKRCGGERKPSEPRALGAEYEMQNAPPVYRADAVDVQQFPTLAPAPTYADRAEPSTVLFVADVEEGETLEAITGWEYLRYEPGRAAVFSRLASIAPTGENYIVGIQTAHSGWRTRVPIQILFSAGCLDLDEAYIGQARNRYQPYDHSN